MEIYLPNDTLAGGIPMACYTFGDFIYKLAATFKKKYQFDNV